MMFIIGGAIVGAVVGGIGWAIDRYNRQRRYEKETQEQEVIIETKKVQIVQLREANDELEVEAQKNHENVRLLKTDAQTHLEGRDSYRAKTEFFKERRD